MNIRRIIAGGAAATLAVSGALALNSAAVASPLEADINDARSDLVGNVDPDLLTAMTDHFDITHTEAYDRLALESVAHSLETELSSEDDFAGLWVNDDGTAINVASTGTSLTSSDISHVAADYSLSELEAVTDQLDTLSDRSLEYGVHGWYVDVIANEVVIESADTAGAESFISDSDASHQAITVDTSTEAPEPYYVAGGIPYSTPGAGCSVGFAVQQGNTKGFVTAGHCGQVGTQVTGGNPAPGVFRTSVFPGSDAAWVEVAANKVLHPLVQQGGNWVQVNNSNEAAVGASICRSGMTTGWQCGVLQAKNQSVTYPEGTIFGVTRTSACAQPGDSGGSFIAGNSAQGVTSGGSGNCSTGGTTFYQPLIPMLNSWNLTLVTQQVN